MKIAVELQNHAIAITLKNIFKENCKFWSSANKPIYDLLDEYKPDVMIVDISSITPIVIEAINEYKTRLVLYGSGVPEGLSPDIVCAKASTSSFIRRHIEDSAKNVIYEKEAAKVCFDVKPNKFSRRKVGHISLTDEPKAIHQKVVEMGQVYYPKSIVGKKIMVEYYLGHIDLDDMHSYICANDIYIDFDETFLLEAAAYGKYVISPKNNSLFSLFSVDNLGEKCHNILSDKRYKKEAKDAQLKVWEADTCYHRVAEMLKVLEAPEFEIAQELIKERRKCALELS